MHIILFYFFFFQAEDGIRDKLVTGVQTCALPIYPRARLNVGVERDGDSRQDADDRDDDHQLDQGEASLVAEIQMPSVPKSKRSEERRVGKECRSRWSPYH